MHELLASFSTWGAALTLCCFDIFLWLQKKTHLAIFNPLLLSAMAIGCLLLALRIPYDSYRESASILSWLLLPATVSLAIPLSEQWPLLRKNAVPILAGIVCGCLTSLCCIFLLVKIFHLDSATAVSLLPKSVTTAIGADVSAELGGIPALTVVIIILTGIAGNLMAPLLCRIFRIKSAVARGIAIGACSHAIGTARALEMGEQEGAMSGLAIAVSGIFTAILSPLAVRLL